MSTTTTPCTCCGRPTFWTVSSEARCWSCTPDGVAVVASVPLRAVVAGRVFAAGRPVPAVLVSEVAPVI